MSGKGSDRRPTQVDEQTFSSNWERIFNSGLPERSKGTGSNPVTGIAPNNVGSNPTAAAMYVDDATGAQVSEHWWPGMPHDAT